ncbi:sensor domain-containing diguanylate cyclase [Vibrio diazotrophicus]|uniref:sensor domain-containing diguanylate cyclase n=1 Tax=Vibrio diazotrophicus TaxID=685 RepID=UPI00142D2E08|nr:sensor domain-containing diguanylate cyclase [Vibrio diazotrophicus]NIY92508.1 sensor domain-containing diguanylate cyclase [Vibrio diazotrophicus]
MPTERKFPPSKLSNLEKGREINLPVEFIQGLSSALSLQEVLDSISQWIHKLFDAERASITLQNGNDLLKLYSISGNKAIPLDYDVPISNTFVGRVFSQRTLTVCDDLEQSHELDCQLLSQFGLKTCMDAPLISGDICLGTLNVAHNQTNYYTELHALKLQCLANWIALNIRLHLQVKELKHLALTDHLTGAPNRRAFTTTIMQSIHEFHEQGKLFCIGLMDIDHFKALNDRYGHNAGDYVLQHVVKITAEIVNYIGHISRIGGEEFAIILYQSSEQEAVDLFKTIKDALANSVIKYDDDEICFTVSIGVTHVNESDNAPESLLRRSDQALYKAKSMGRNRVNTFTTARLLS